MITLRKSEERGHADHGWLDTRHTFSFADYYDPDHMEFRSLRVINEDFVEPGQGFPPHPHRDMEILTYVLGGAVRHEDSMGNEGVIRAGEVQRMTAGTGVVHSEVNPSDKETLHLLQIWIRPDRPGYTPEYEQKAFGDEEKRGKLALVASRDGRDGSLKVHQDVDLYATVLDAKDEVVHRLAKGRQAWVQVARGEIDLNGQALKQGDGAAVSAEGSLKLSARKPSEVLLFDLK